MKIERRQAYEALMAVYPLTIADLDGEQWENFNARYQISTCGRVKSFCHGTPQILRPLLVGQGYLAVTIHENGRKPRHFKIHRLVAQMFIQNPENKREVNHIDGNPMNNHISNLEWVTPAENKKHATALGLYKSGEDRHDAKLTNEQAAWCRENYIPFDPDFGASAFARRFGVCRNTIERILRGERYKNGTE